MKTKPKHRNYKLHPSTMVKFWKSGIISRFLAVVWKNEWKRTIMNSWMFIRNELIQEVDFVTISVYWFHICRVEDFNFFFFLFFTQQILSLRLIRKQLERKYNLWKKFEPFYSLKNLRSRIRSFFIYFPNIHQLP